MHMDAEVYEDGAISNGRWRIEVLEPLPWPFKHERCSYALKLGKWHECW